MASQAPRDNTLEHCVLRNSTFSASSPHSVALFFLWWLLPTLIFLFLRLERAASGDVGTLPESVPGSLFIPEYVDGRLSWADERNDTAVWYRTFIRKREINACCVQQTEACTNSICGFFLLQ
jgi:hypothetical protein